MAGLYDIYPNGLSGTPEPETRNALGLFTIAGGLGGALAARTRLAQVRADLPAPRPNPAIHIRPDGFGGFGLHLKAGNNEIVCDGESYTRREDAVRAAERIRALWAIAPIVHDY